MNTGLCHKCGFPNHPDRLELGLPLCIDCAYLYPAPPPKALTVCLNQEGDTETLLIPPSSASRLVELNYIPQPPDQ